MKIWKRRVWLSTLIEATTGPAIAILFWMVIILIVLMTFAHGKFFEANFFEAFGAIGQVMFAAAVFWLGKQQFDFTKQMTERQARIDTYAIKNEILRRFLTLFEMAERSSEQEYDDDYIAAWYELADDAARVFDVEELDLTIVFLAEKLAELRSDTEYMRQLNERHKGDLPAMQAALRENWKKVEEYRFKAWWLMHQEIIIRNRDTPPGFDCSKAGSTTTNL